MYVPKNSLVKKKKICNFTKFKNKKMCFYEKILIDVLCIVQMCNIVKN